MIFAGIDPGLQGAVAIVDSGKLLDMQLLSPMLNLGHLIDYLQRHRVRVVGLEKAQAMPRQGIASTFQYGLGFGIILGQLQVACLPHRLIHPVRWTKWAHSGCKAAADAKQRSKEAVTRLFPGVSFLATPKCRVPHAGLVDAALIAAYLDATWSQDDGKTLQLFRSKDVSEVGTNK